MRTPEFSSRCDGEVSRAMPFCVQIWVARFPQSGRMRSALCRLRTRNQSEIHTKVRLSQFLQGLIHFESKEAACFLLLAVPDRRAKLRVVWKPPKEIPGRFNTLIRDRQRAFNF